MLEQITLVLKCQIYPSVEQKDLILQTKMAYQQALNETSKHVFDKMDKKPTTARLQHELYREIRTKYHLGSQMTQSVFRQVKATYQGLWTKTNQHLQHHSLGYTTKHYKGLDRAPFYNGTTMDLVYGKDFSFKSNKQVSILTLKGRIVLGYDLWNERLPLLKSPHWKIGTAKLSYCKRKKQFYLHIPVTSQVHIEAEGFQEIVGVDVGMRYLAVTDNGEKPFFFKSGLLKNKKKQHQKLRTELQKKGTRSAKRKLKKVSQRERQFTSQVNHLISKEICKKNRLIGIEDLTNIREKTSTYRKNKEDRRQREQWSFADLHSKIAYKSLLNGGFCIKIDPRYTSQDCPKCKHRSKENRPNKGLLFCCQNCGYSLHADYIAAKNIRQKTIDKWQVHLSIG